MTQKATKKTVNGEKMMAAGVRKKQSSSKKKLGRNSDGTFAPNNKLSVGNNGGRPPEELSFRYQVKLRAEKDPGLVERAIDTLFKIAIDPKHPKCVEAIDKLIKLNGQYDPVESRTELSGVITTNGRSALDDLTIDELRRLKVLKEAE